MCIIANMKLILFLLANVAGFYSVPLLIIYILHNTNVADLPPDIKDDVRPFIESGSMMVWMIASALSISYLFINKNKMKFLFLILPLVSPTIYVFYILNTFNF